MRTVEIILAALVVGGAAGALTVWGVASWVQPSEEQLIENFYLTENAVHVSPHTLRGKMDRGVADYTLVDLRSQEEYEAEHIIGAVSIPAYKDRYTSAYGEKERIIAAFRALPQNKEIIVYCYSTPCMTGRKIGKLLAENGIYVKHLGIGWNEWRYFWNLWNHEHEWNTTRAEDYVWSGPEPGVPVRRVNSTACPLGDSEFGC